MTLGEENGDYYQIIEGIRETDSVVVEGNFNLAHESALQIIEEDSQKPNEKN